MKFIVFSLIIAFCFSCKSQQELTKKSTLLVEILIDSTNSFNELSANTNIKDLNKKLNSTFQSLSENKSILSTDPKERLEKKIKLFEICKNSKEKCQYTPEEYSINQHKKLLNIKYQYNEFSNYDLYYKYALINLSTGLRLKHIEIFSESETILKLYNKKYIDENKSYLKKFDLDSADEDELDEYDIIKSHLDTRSLFELNDLNNIELIYNHESSEFTEIRFHYNGAGGVYKNVLTAGYISFKVNDIRELLTLKFVDLLER